MKNQILFFSIFLSIFVLSCSPSSPKKDPFVDKERTDKSYDVNITHKPKVDILFIIDDSRSMDLYQQNMSRNISLFIDELSRNKLLDYQIGVITSDMENRRQRGKLIGHPAIIKSDTPDGLEILKQRMKVGTAGSGYERFFDPIIML